MKIFGLSIRSAFTDGLARRPPSRPCGFEFASNFVGRELRDDSRCSAFAFSAFGYDAASGGAGAASTAASAAAAAAHATIGC